MRLYANSFPLTPDSNPTLRRRRRGRRECPKLTACHARTQPQGRVTAGAPYTGDHTSDLLPCVLPAFRPCAPQTTETGWPSSTSTHPASRRIARRPFKTVQLIEHLIDRGGRDTEGVALRHTDAFADVGEHGEFTLEVCHGSVAHGLILP